MEPKHCKSGHLGQVKAVFPIGKRSWKSRPLAALLMGVGLLIGGQAQTHEHHGVSVSGGSEISSLMLRASDQPAFPFVDLGVVDSQRGETKNDYMLRVAVVLDQFTQVSGHEACGVVMENKQEDAWRVRLITNRSQVACVRMLFDEPGFTFTDETIHSHPAPKHGRVYANIQDQTLRGFMCGRGVLIEDEDFSPGDIENGPGYLVARGKLLYQRDGQKSTIGEIEKSSVVEGLAYMPNDTGRMSAPSSYQAMITSLVNASYISAWSSRDREGIPAVSCKSARPNKAKK